MENLRSGTRRGRYLPHILRVDSRESWSNSCNSFFPFFIKLVHHIKRRREYRRGRARVFNLYRNSRSYMRDSGSLLVIWNPNHLRVRRWRQIFFVFLGNRGESGSDVSDFCIFLKVELSDFLKRRRARHLQIITRWVDQRKCRFNVIEASSLINVKPMDFFNRGRRRYVYIPSRMD